MNNWKSLTYRRKSADSRICQDHVVVKESESTLVACLADGISTYKYSELASEVATKVTCNILLDVSRRLSDFNDKKEVASFIIGSIKKHIVYEVNQKGISIDDLNCTLVFVAILKDKNRAIIGQLGDSALCVFKDDKPVLLTDNNVSVINRTGVLDIDAADKLKIKVLDLTKDHIGGFVLCSDGMEGEVFNRENFRVNKTAELYINVFQKSLNPQKTVSDRIESLNQRYNNDDMSVAILSSFDHVVELADDPTWLCTCTHRNNIKSMYCEVCNRAFTDIYKNIRFVEYGGKAKFFERINQNENEERILIGLPSLINEFENTPEESYTYDDMKVSEPLIEEEPAGDYETIDTLLTKKPTDSEIEQKDTEMENEIILAAREILERIVSGTTKTTPVEEIEPVEVSEEEVESVDIQKITEEEQEETEDISKPLKVTAPVPVPPATRVKEDLGKLSFKQWLIVDACVFALLGFILGSSFTKAKMGTSLDPTNEVSEVEGENKEEENKQEENKEEENKQEENKPAQTPEKEEEKPTTQNDPKPEETPKPAEPEMATEKIVYMAIIRSSPGLSSDLEIGKAEEGSTVYIFDEPSVDAEGYTWIKIKTQDNCIGWIKSEAIY